MAKPIQIAIKESIKELKALQRGLGELLSKRVRVLIELKKHEKAGISKRDLSEITGINHNSNFTGFCNTPPILSKALTVPSENTPDQKQFFLMIMQQ